MTPSADRNLSGKKHIFAWGFAVLWCLVTSIFAVLLWMGFSMARDAQERFVQTDGRILSSNVQSHTDSDGTTYSPAVTYEYTVDGQTYRNDRVDFLDFSSSNAAYARRVVNANPAGETVPVWYDPDQPQLSTLYLEIPPTGWFLLLFIQPFVLVGIGTLIWAVKTTRTHGQVKQFLQADPAQAATIPTWGTLRQEMAGLTIRGGASRLWRGLIGLFGGYGVTIFIGSFIILLLLDSDMNPRQVITLMLIAGGVGLLGGLWGLAKPSGKARLSIDPGLRRLQLKSPKRDHDLGFDQIAGWGVCTVVDPRPTSTKNRRQTGPNMASMLAMKTTDEQVVPVHIFPPGEDGDQVAEQSAELFATLTARPIVPIDPPQEYTIPPQTPESVSDIVQVARDARRKGKALADIT